MSEHTTKVAMSPPSAYCKITIRDSSDVPWTEFVKKLPMSMHVGDYDTRLTTLVGSPIDLGAFLGTLHMLVDLGFPVVGAEYDQGYCNVDEEGGC